MSICTQLRCTILDLLQNIKHGRCVPNQFQKAMDAFMAAFVQAGWKKFAKKFPWLEHFAGELAKFGFLLKCWSTEKKSKILQLLGQLVQDTSVFLCSTKRSRRKF